MEDFLRKHKLIDDFTVELPIAKSDFVNRLRNAVDPGKIGLITGPFEAWESSKNDYKGEVTNQGFKIRRRKKFFQSNGQQQAVATGTFTEERDKLIVRTEVNSQVRKMVPFYGIAALVYLAAISTLTVIILSDEGPDLPLFILVFIIAHAGLMFFLFYYIAKRGVANLKRELEREFVFLANKN